MNYSPHWGHYIGSLKWILLLQDCALLHTKYPQLPLFSYLPFNSATFREFAAASAARISDVETSGHLAVKNLLQTLVRSFQGAVSSLTMAQHAARDELRAQMLSLEAQIQALALRINDVDRPQRRSRDTVNLVLLIPPPFLPSLAPAIVHISNETSVRLGIATTIEDGMYIPPDQSPFQTHPFSASTEQHAPGSTSLSMASVISPSSSTPSASQPASSSVEQTAAWNLLSLRYTDARLRRHTWDWIEAMNSFLPKYDFQPVKKITDIWTEWATGLNGFLSIRELEEGWNSRWKRDSRKIKSEWSRRSKVIKLIEGLQKKPNWNLELALRFIRETYEMDRQFNTVRKFCDYIQSSKTGGLDAVFTKSCTFVN
ncbi:hypothetical protein DFH07DRAFT_961631 [Mycena maculata]|uniref:Transcription activator GCR1-like domain-containing protein n=1 Tax=Mycena maculata TaxID=230809 RepID=A0AAD7IT20_9AGAR|nr:hypothetical protein DFH07DRAFT_961631 [Mycena maculata]